VDPGRARRDHRLGQFERIEWAAEAGLSVRDDRREPVETRVGAFGERDLVRAQQRVVDSPDHRRYRVDRVEALVRVRLPRRIAISRDLPAGQIDGRQAAANHLDGLVAGDRAERVHVVGGGKQIPEALGTATGEGVLLADRSAQPDDVLSRVGALDTAPPRVGLPPPGQLGRLGGDASINSGSLSGLRPGGLKGRHDRS
jgi:hypothetical protein